MIGTVQTLMTGLIDYAGLFPPAGLGMNEAVANYARDLGGTDAFALSKFICPASRLDELSESARVLLPGTYATSGYREMALQTDPWSISVVGDLPLDQTLDAIDAFNSRHDTEEKGLAKVRALEIRGNDAQTIDAMIEAIPEDLPAFFELPLDVDFRGLVATLAGNPGIGGKVRCGGVKPEMIPTSERVAAFIAACAAADVPFKATAGLHHPVRAEQDLTYENDAPRAVMHGYLNLFIGASLARVKRLDHSALEEILNETDPDAFTLEEDRVAWRDVAIDRTQFARCRESFCVGYGSCSFTEPLQDLRVLGHL
tara:strand:- start:761 stop:1699 length:939 start_codon:yes stop_codon:yes gene_type:complete